MIRGTQADQLTEILKKIPKRLRRLVEEVTLDMAASMNATVQRCFPNAHRVIDRFHVQKLAFEAVQEIRIIHRWQALEEENTAIDQAKRQGRAYQPDILPNGDSAKRLLARSRYLLFKHPGAWTREQRQRAELLFTRYPVIHKGYQLSLRLGEVFRIVRVKNRHSRSWHYGTTMWRKQVCHRLKPLPGLSNIIIRAFSTSSTTELPMQPQSHLMRRSKRLETR
ncbi:transposase [Chitinophaga sp.]|uniref:transposase n=1 Tax=Chitinophaga sp. TaxID=1869181 RepID=UPI0031D7E879